MTGHQFPIVSPRRPPQTPHPGRDVGGDRPKAPGPRPPSYLADVLLFAASVAGFVLFAVCSAIAIWGYP
jgi:hypothetical protein